MIVCPWKCAFFRNLHGDASDKFQAQRFQVWLIVVGAEILSSVNVILTWHIKKGVPVLKQPEDQTQIILQMIRFFLKHRPLASKIRPPRGRISFMHVEVCGLT